MRKEDLTAADPYYGQWMTYRSVWRRSLGLTLLLFLGGGLLSLGLVEVLWPAAPSWAQPASVLPWAVAAIVAGQAPIRWPCPRCGKPFHSTFWFRNAFAKRCVHCRLPKWARSPTSDPASEAAA